MRLNSRHFAETIKCARIFARNGFHKVSTEGTFPRHPANPSIPTHLAANMPVVYMIARRLLWKHEAVAQIVRGPRNNRAGRKKMALRNDRTPSTAIPTIRNGSRMSQTKG